MPDDLRTGAATALAPLSRRLGALVADWLLCLLVAGFAGSARTHPWAAPAVLLVEYGFFLGLIGQTPGMYLTRIRCVRVRGGLIGVPMALLRAALLLLVLPAVFLDADRRGLHDRAAGSVVVAA